ncbi:MAG: phosphatase PAP2 family protein [Pseudomonadota bacterium]|nr:phosphatase PAP2 family protein [Pseudomonadota bacterium]
MLRTPADAAVPIGPGWLREFMADATTLGGWPLLTIFVALIAVFLAMRRHWRSALILLAAVLGQTIIVGQIKNLFGRARPEIVPHLAEVSSYSFPSGHAASAAAVYLTLAAILSREAAPRRERLFIVMTAMILTVLVGVSRVYLGVHYPTDVLAGWAFGAAWASLVLLAARFLERRGHDSGLS